MKHTYDYIFKLYCDVFLNNRKEYEKAYNEAIKEKTRNPNANIKKETDKNFFKAKSKEILKNIDIFYAPFFLNIGKSLDTHTEKGTYKDIFLKSQNTMNNKYKNIKSLLLDNIISFENELEKIKFIKTKWAILEYKFKLEDYYFSRDDSYFYVIDNPLKKDKAFKISFIAPSTWKGMLRFIAVNYVTEDKEAIKRIFGNEKDDEFEYSGALRAYPSFFDRIDMVVQNPFDRINRKGTNPIYYEVVPEQSKSVLIITYIPKFSDQDYFEKDLNIITQSVKLLIEKFGISAKKSVGWGKAKIIEEKVITYENVGA